MNYIFRGLGSGFGRTIGRIFAYIFIAVVLFFLIKYLGIDLKSIIPKLSLGGFW